MSRAPLGAVAQRMIAVGLWAAVVIAAGTWAVTQDVGPGEGAARLVEAIQGSPWGAVVFVAAYLVRPLFFFSAAALTVAGGFLFGAPLGIALVVVAANASALIAYGIARWLGSGFVSRSDDGGLARWTGRMRARSFETVLLMRLLYLPYDLVSYLAGAVRIHPGAFFAATAIGSAPATVAFVLVGASLESFDGGVPRIDGPILIASAVLLVLGIAISQVLRRREGARDGAA